MQNIIMVTITMNQYENCVISCKTLKKSKYRQKYKQSKQLPVKTRFSFSFQNLTK